MLQLLRVRNFALIDELSLEFAPRLNVLSGETGAGKSLIVDALGLLAGARASADAIRSGERRAVVEAVVTAPPDIDLESMGLDPVPPGDELVVRREISADGKNRVFINSQPATASALRSLAPLVLEIHGQHEQQTLLDRATQLLLIDRAADALRLRSRVGDLYREIRSLRSELEDLEARDAGARERQDLLSFQKKEIERLRPEVDEADRLRDQVRALEHSERLLDATGSAYQTIYESESSLLGHLSSIQRALEGVATHDARLEPMIAQIQTSRSALEDAAWGLRDYVHQLDLDPGALEHLQSRLAEFERLGRKYGADLLSHLEKVREELDRTGLQGDRRSSLIGQLERLEKDFLEAAAELGERRRESSPAMAARITAQVRTLAMPEAVFSIEWARTGEPGPTGLDQAVWHLAPNPGEEAAPLAAIASGGELSRTMLALRTVMAAGGSTQTLVFDEIDAGVGGEAAERVGRKLRDLSATYQVLCVTHLAGIARFADRQIHIGKKVTGGRTRTEAALLEGEARVEALARMMSGTRITQAARQHVRELLSRE